MKHLYRRLILWLARPLLNEIERRRVAAQNETAGILSVLLADTRAIRVALDRLDRHHSWITAPTMGHADPAKGGVDNSTSTPRPDPNAIHYSRPAPKVERRRFPR